MSNFLNYNVSENNCVHRTYCDTLRNMRDVLNTLDKHNTDIVKSTIFALIEECQMYGDRMEAGLDYGSDLKALHKKRKDLQLEVSKLEDIVELYDKMEGK